eukprot:scaffold240919_cov22-Prasinocladus_malaysianus.AAC.1
MSWVVLVFAKVSARSPPRHRGVASMSGMPVNDSPARVLSCRLHMCQLLRRSTSIPMALHVPD